MSPLVVAFAVLAAQPVPLAAVGLKANGVPSTLAETLSNTLALRLRETKQVTVTTPEDIGAVLGLERQRQLLGCTEGSNSCTAELAGALGVKGVVVGEVAKVGATYQLSVRVVDAQDGQAVFSAMERRSDEEALLAAVDRLARDAAGRVATRFGGPAAAAGSAGSAGPWIVGLAGAGCAVVGGVLWALAGGDHAALRAKTPTTYDAAVQLRQAGELKQALGLGLLGVGVASGLAGLLWGLLGTTSSVSVLPASGGFVVQGAL